MARVFGGQLRSAGNIPVQVHNLRRAIMGAGGDASLIQTVGQGYRFVGDLLPMLQENVPAPAVSASASTKTQLSGLQFGCAVTVSGVAAMLLIAWFTHWFGWRGAGDADQLSIAVIPFDYRGTDQSHAYLADAITDDLAGELERIPLSTVSARSSAVHVKGESSQKIGRDLDVRYVLEGSVLSGDGRYSINAELTDTRTGAILKTVPIESTGDRFSDVEQDIARTIAGQLHLALDQIVAARAAQDRPDNPTAQDDFFRARSKLDAGGQIADLTEAQRLLTRAIERQPNFPEALAELGWTLLRKSTGMDDPTEGPDYAMAKDVIDKALALSPQNATALAARAKILQTDGKCDEAAGYAARALSIENSNIRARAVLAKCAMTDGRLDDAAIQYEGMLRLNPENPGNSGLYVALGYIRLIDGDYAKAKELLSRSIDADEKPEPFSGMNADEQARVALIAVYALAGQRDKAAAAYRVYDQTWPGRSVWRVAAYWPKNWLSQAGMQRALDALRASGMPAFSPENAPGIADGASCEDGDFAPTPLNIPGGKVATTAIAQQSLRMSKKPLVIDVARGAAVISGAVWSDPTVTTETPWVFALRIAAEHARSNKQLSIIVAGDGPYGCDAYRSALALIGQGYRNVSWYRGGEEAWKAAGGYSEDRRPF